METGVNTKKENNFWSKALSLIFIVVLVFSVGLTFFKFFVLRDYTIQSQVECDPYTEVCFTYHCDPTVEECSGDSVADTFYYKLLDRNAKNILLCNPAEESCAPLLCLEDEAGCVITFCDVSVDETVECTNPEQYSAENPIVENLEEVSIEQVDPVEVDLNTVPVE